MWRNTALLGPRLCCAHVLSGIVSLACVEVLTPGPVDVSLFGNRVFTGVIG